MVTPEERATHSNDLERYNLHNKTPRRAAALANIHTRSMLSRQSAPIFGPELAETAASSPKSLQTRSQDLLLGVSRTFAVSVRRPCVEPFFARAEARRGRVGVLSGAGGCGDEIPQRSPRIAFCHAGRCTDALETLRSYWNGSPQSIFEDLPRIGHPHCLNPAKL